MNKYIVFFDIGYRSIGKQFEAQNEDFAFLKAKTLLEENEWLRIEIPVDEFGGRIIEGVIEIKSDKVVSLNVVKKEEITND